ncbi:MAG: helix-turn-helix transcriptional regulator [Litorimonas sp.]
MNTKDVAADIRYCRRESGLSGADVSHLLSITRPRLSRIENGRSEPRPMELCGLALIYGKQHLDMFPALTENLVTSIKRKLTNMPSEPTVWRARQKRLQCLNELTHRLQAIAQHNHD